MKTTRLAALLASALLATGAVHAQVVPAQPPVDAASAPRPAASRPVVTPSPAVRAAENSRTPGDFKPEQPVIPQITVPIKRKNDTRVPDAGASSAGVPGGVNDSAARCLAATGAKELANCPSNGPVRANAPR